MLKDRFEEAMAFHRAGGVGQAEAIYRDLLREDPEHAGAWHLLGVLLHARRDLSGALVHIERALSLCDFKAVYWNNYGAVLKDSERFEEAKAAFEKAVGIRDEYPDAWSNLGLVQTELGDPEEAERSIRYALRLEPRHGDALRHLAVVCRQKGEFEEALRVCQDAAAVAPGNAQVFEVEGGILVEMKRYKEAAAAYEKAVACDPTAVEALLNRGFAYSDLDEPEKARESFRRAAELQPDRPMWRLRHLSLCPTIFQTVGDVTEYRAGLEHQLDAALAEGLSFDWRDALRDGVAPSFQLSFHGVCNRGIKEKFARLFAAHFPRERPKFGKREKIRVGFLCTKTHEVGFARGFGGIMQRLDRRRFEILGLVSDDVVPFCRKSVPTNDVRWIGFPHQLEPAWKTIREAACDIIVHWHAGSDVVNYFLPFLPLAPFQCIGFGANGTTGISNIDCFVSSRLFERGEDAEEDYTEWLVQFDGLTTWQARPRVDRSATRADFGLPSSAAIYFCPQQLGKFHPDFDRLLRRVLEEDPNGCIVALKGRQHAAADALRARLERTLGETLSRRVILLPTQEGSAYYRLFDLADVVLDAPNFSTSLTGFDAFALGKPIVTLPGRHMAQRYAIGLYKRMELPDLIARSEPEYVKLAVRLGGDAECRRAMRTEILERCDLLYEDARVVRSYESFFEQTRETGR